MSIVLDKHVHNMTVRLEAAVAKTADAFADLMDVVVLCNNTIKARGACAITNGLESMQDAIDASFISAQQLKCYAALCQWSNCVPLLPLVSHMPVRANWLPTLLAPVNVDLNMCFVSANEPTLCEFSGQGLTSYYPQWQSQENIIRIVVRDGSGAICNWVTNDDIHLVFFNLNGSYNVTLHNDTWIVMYSLCNNDAQDKVEFTVQIGNFVFFKCNVQVMCKHCCAMAAQCVHAIYFQAMTIDDGIALAIVTKTKRDPDEFAIRELVNIASAFPTDYNVQVEICRALWTIAYNHTTTIARLILQLGGVETLLTAFSTFRNMEFVVGCALFHIAKHGGPAVIATLQLRETFVYIMTRANIFVLLRPPLSDT